MKFNFMKAIVLAIILAVAAVDADAAKSALRSNPSSAKSRLVTKDMTTSRAQKKSASATKKAKLSKGKSTVASKKSQVQAKRAEAMRKKKEAAAKRRALARDKRAAAAKRRALARDKKAAAAKRLALSRSMKVPAAKRGRVSSAEQTRRQVQSEVVKLREEKAAAEAKTARMEQEKTAAEAKIEELHKNLDQDSKELREIATDKAMVTLKKSLDQDFDSANSDFAALKESMKNLKAERDKTKTISLGSVALGANKSTRDFDRKKIKEVVDTATELGKLAKKAKGIAEGDKLQGDQKMLYAQQFQRLAKLADDASRVYPEGLVGDLGNTTMNKEDGTVVKLKDLLKSTQDETKTMLDESNTLLAAVDSTAG